MKSKKNIKGIIIIAILVITSMFFINMSFAANTGKINVETANLRDEANSDSKILEQISINEEVEILEKTGEWYKVKYKKITGFIRQDLITTTEQESTTTENQNTQNTETTQPESTQIVESTTEPEQTIEKKEEIQVGNTYQIIENTKLKIVPSINATDIIEVKKDEGIIVTEIINGWVCIETETTKGWIRQEKLKSKEEEIPEEEKPVEQPQEQQEKQPAVEEKKPEVVEEKLLKTQYVKSTTVNLRAEPSTSANVVAMVAINTPVEVYAEENGWSKVKIKSIAKEGYISSSLLSDKKQETSRGAQESRPKTTNSVTQSNQTTQNTETTNKQTQTTTSSNAGASVVETAKQYIGSKYVYGGSTPSGFDCSGFTSYVYKQHGVSLNRTAAGQYSNGTAVSKSELQPGDLVMFGKSGINHVGIYIGGGQIVHAANSSRGVTTDTINSGYYANNYVGARRIK